MTNTTAPVVSGTAKVEGVLSVNIGSWNVAPQRTTVQWYADGQPITGAVASSLRLLPEMAGKVISAKVTATRSTYDPVTVTSAGTVPVALGTIRVSRAPTLGGTAKPGQTLSLDPGAYLPGDAATAVQWLRDGQPVLNATGPTYRVTSLDLGSRISSRVTVSRAGYESSTLTSPLTVPVRVTPRIHIARERRKHVVRLTITVTAPYVAAVEGSVRVRVLGGFNQTVELHHGVARVNVAGVPRGKRALGVTYLGGPTVEKSKKMGYVRAP
jgi:hypothetical protein